MKYHYTGAPRTCDRCGETYAPKAHNQRFCSAACKCAESLDGFRSRNPEYWQKYMARKRRDAIKVPNAIKPEYNHEPCRLCKRPLGRTANRWYHIECHRRISHLEGIDCFEINTHQRNGHYKAN